MIAAALTDIAGSSDVVERGFVTYSNEAKTEMLGVPADLIAKFGAVSEQVAREMAAGALRHAHADVTVAVTGAAGPRRRVAGKARRAGLSGDRPQGRRDALRAQAVPATAWRSDLRDGCARPGDAGRGGAVTRILGVDFSGASDAGRKIWIAEGRRNARALALASCIPAIDLPGSGKAPASAVRSGPPHRRPGRGLVGCDFPFSLPRDQLDARTWRAFALGYAALRRCRQLPRCVPQLPRRRRRSSA